ncbi:hypothetical protein LC605_25330 [Nostoc sp. CHAB 5836]|nr:hypothetical protein [Nostoc sp. CHAB 5836]
MLRNVNRLKTLVNDEGQMTNDSLSQLALIAPTYLLNKSARINQTILRNANTP